MESCSITLSKVKSSQIRIQQVESQQIDDNFRNKRHATEVQRLQTGKSGAQSAVKPSVSSESGLQLRNTQNMPACPAPTEALDEADDAGLTPAHRRPVHGAEGGHAIQGCAARRSSS